MELNKVYLGNCLEVMKTFEDNSVDSITTDPPYGLKFMGKKWDYNVPSVEIWQEALRVLKPGGHLLSFGGSRTYHRMAVAIEDAGFEIRDQIMWVYGSGFSKSHNIGKSVDKLQGNEREDLGYVEPFGRENRKAKQGKGTGTVPFSSEEGMDSKNHITKGTSPYEGWGTALKPSHEDIVLAQKPLEYRTDTEYNRDICRTLLAIIVANSSTLNLAEPSEGLSIAQWSVEKNINTLDDLKEVMAILQSSKTESISLNTVLSWLNILAENWLAKNTSTISTKLNTITELKILHSLEWESILKSITQAKDNQTSGFSVDVYNAISLLNVVELKLNYIQEHSVNASATLSEKLKDLRPSHNPIVVARKPLSEKTIALNVLKWGTAGINIDGCRVEYEKEDWNNAVKKRKSFEKTGGGYQDSYVGGSLEKPINTMTSIKQQGRFPANFILSYPENSYIIKESLTIEQKEKALKWIYENAKHTMPNMQDTTVPKTL